MSMIAADVDRVIGVDTHKLSHTAAVVDTSGGRIADATLPADAFGYKRIYRFACQHAPPIGGCGR